jgi:hypothetical protein
MQNYRAAIFELPFHYSAYLIIGSLAERHLVVRQGATKRTLNCPQFPPPSPYFNIDTKEGRSV